MHEISRILNETLNFAGEHTPVSNLFLFNSMGEYHKNIDFLEEKTPYFARIFGNPRFITYATDSNNNPIVVNLNNTDYIGAIFGIDNPLNGEGGNCVIVKMVVSNVVNTLYHLKNLEIDSVLISKTEKGLGKKGQSTKEVFNLTPTIIGIRQRKFKLI